MTGANGSFANERECAATTCYAPGSEPRGGDTDAGTARDPRRMWPLRQLSRLRAWLESHSATSHAKYRSRSFDRRQWYYFADRSAEFQERFFAADAASSANAAIQRFNQLGSLSRAQKDESLDRFRLHLTQAIRISRVELPILFVLYNLSVLSPFVGILLGIYAAWARWPEVAATRSSNIILLRAVALSMLVAVLPIVPGFLINVPIIAALWWIVAACVAITVVIAREASLLPLSAEWLIAAATLLGLWFSVVLVAIVRVLFVTPYMTAKRREYSDALLVDHLFTLLLLLEDHGDRFGEGHFRREIARGIRHAATLASSAVCDPEASAHVATDLRQLSAETAAGFTEYESWLATPQRDTLDALRRAFSSALFVSCMGWYHLLPRGHAPIAKPSPRVALRRAARFALIAALPWIGIACSKLLRIAPDAGWVAYATLGALLWSVLVALLYVEPGVVKQAFAIRGLTSLFRKPK
jgi:hypothetical protein